MPPKWRVIRCCNSYDVTAGTEIAKRNVMTKKGKAVTTKDKKMASEVATVLTLPRVAMANLTRVSLSAQKPTKELRMLMAGRVMRKPYTK
jgi:hypothetical protein